MKITENTAISLSVLVAVLGAVAWLTRIAYISEGNAESIRSVITKQEVYSSEIADIRKDIAVIRQILEGTK